MAERKPWGWKEALVFLAVGTELALFTVIGAYVGNWLDGQWETGPWGMAIGLSLGAAAGFLHLFRLARRFF
jgi:F0F1-type ATP synthase assembly protein I